MAFDKQKYWEDKPNNIGSKRPKTQAIPPLGLDVVLVKGQITAKNRAFRRTKASTNLYKRKGFIESLNAIRIKRLKKGKVTYKYVLLNKQIRPNFV